MSLRSFLDAAYALLIEAYQQAGKMNLFEALDEAAMWKAGYREGEAKVSQTATTASTRDDSLNDQELAKLQAMLAGM